MKATKGQAQKFWEARAKIMRGAGELRELVKEPDMLQGVEGNIVTYTANIILEHLENIEPMAEDLRKAKA